MIRVARLGAAMSLALVLSLSASMGASGAHEGRGAIAVLAADPVEPLAVAYRVRLTFQADGHPVDRATLTVVAQEAGGGGGGTTPVPMQPSGEPGTYAATVRFPAAGTWTVRFTAVTPPAVAERTDVLAPPPTSSTTSTTGTVPTTVPPDGDGGGSGPLVLVLVGGVLGAAAATVWLRRRGATDGH